MQNNNLCQSIICYSSPSGSPAEKADLEVADEILEVNGESLENSNHTDVIAHIHNVRFSDDLTTTLQKKTKLIYFAKRLLHKNISEIVIISKYRKYML